MSTGGKIIVLTAMIVVLGGGAYLYYRKKKGQPLLPASITGAEPVAQGTPQTGATSQVPASGSGSVGTPVSNATLPAGTDPVLGTPVAAPSNPYANAPVPLPADLTAKEQQDLQNFCTMPRGMAILPSPNTQYGVAYLLRKRANTTMDLKQYHTGLKVWRGCP